MLKSILSSIVTLLIVSCNSPRINHGQGELTFKDVQQLFVDGRVNDFYINNDIIYVFCGPGINYSAKCPISKDEFISWIKKNSSNPSLFFPVPAATIISGTTGGAIILTRVSGSGQPIPGCTVTCINLADKKSWKTLSNDIGESKFGMLPAGYYTFRITHERYNFKGIRNVFTKIRPGETWRVKSSCWMRLDLSQYLERNDQSIDSVPSPPPIPTYSCDSNSSIFTHEELDVLPLK